MPPIVVVIQHGQAEHHVNGMTGGWTDTGLTETGHDQARRIALFVRQTFGSDLRVVSSDLRRALETAQPLADLLGLPVVADPGLRELNNGVAAHQTREWAQNHRRTVPRTFDFDARDWEGAETWRELLSRIGSTMDRLTADLAGTLVVVSHGCAIASLVKWWLHCTDPAQIGSIHFEGSPGGVSVLGTNSWGQNVVRSFNLTGHLV